jgi:cytochrome c-type biogenesis protein CcmH/NrfG
MRMLRLVLVFAMTFLVACTPGQSLRPDEDLPRRMEDLQQLARETYEQQDWAGSEKYYRAWLDRMPGEVEPWFRLGNIYARTERPDEAVAAYREALVRDPQRATAWHNMGVLYLRQAANSFLQMQTHVDPQDPLYARGTRIFQGIGELLQGEHGE